MEEYNEELMEIKRKHDNEVKEMKVSKEKARLEDLQGVKVKESSFKFSNTGNKSRRERLAELRRNETVIGTIERKKPETTVSEAVPPPTS
ncbi:unnamed protein product [[Candida] boidinii]|nr:unnamed protein product [[Candida] boidinii]